MMTCRFILVFAAFVCCGGLSPAWGQDAGAAPSVVRVVKKGDGYQLMRNGQPFVIKGAGGSDSKTLLKQVGGNSFRTWGADNLEPQLAEAQTLGLAVTIGIWLGHRDQGFHYDDPAQVAKQYETTRQAILRYKNSPALLVWALGNEMETGGAADDPAVWAAVEKAAALAHQLDPNHPTMTVIAELGGGKIAALNKYCPDIDIVGINSYAGAASVGQRYKAAGGVKPYVLTEFGPPGTWELPKNAWGAALEPTSTAKADWYRKAYQGSVAGQPLCLGSYAFTWGHKQEATATWFGMLLPDGSRLGAVDAMQELWTGKPPADRCPQIAGLKVTGPDQVAPGTPVTAALDASDPEGEPLKVEWVLQSDPASYHVGGASEAMPPTYPDAILHSDAKTATVKMPAGKGAYRLFAYVRDGHGGAAVANVPLFVTGGAQDTAVSTPKATLPLVVYDEAAGRADLPFIPSGYMGNAAAVHMDDACVVLPHTGKTCLRVEYGAGDTWGDQPGGWNLTGAKALTFWARGEKGGEVVTFEYGLLGRDKTYFDTGAGKLDKVVLTKDWKQYTLPLAGKDLSRLKIGFAWTVVGSGQPVTFFLDDIRYE